MTVKVTKNTMSRSLQKITDSLDNVPEQAYKFWVDITPKRSGNARKKTRLKGSKIQANYPYAKRLNEGWSDQAPQGLAKPTEGFLKQLVKKLMRK